MKKERLERGGQKTPRWGTFSIREGSSSGQGPCSCQGPGSWSMATSSEIPRPQTRSSQSSDTLKKGCSFTFATVFILDKYLFSLFSPFLKKPPRVGPRQGPSVCCFEPQTLDFGSSAFCFNCVSFQVHHSPGDSINNPSLFTRDVGELGSMGCIGLMPINIHGGKSHNKVKMYIYGLSVSFLPQSRRHCLVLFQITMLCFQVELLFDKLWSNHFLFKRKPSLVSKDLTLTLNE